VRVAVDESGQRGPPGGVERGVGGRRLRRGANPGDPAVLDDERGVGEHAERFVVREQLPDVGDEEGARPLLRKAALFSPRR
jgi:hypothetical protein